MMKKPVLLILVCLVWVLTFSACTTTDNPNETAAATAAATAAPTAKVNPTATPEPEPVTLYVCTDYGTYSKDSEQQENVHQAIIDAVGVDLVMVDYPTAEYMTRVELALSSGDRLDIIRNVPIANALKYYNAGATYKITGEMLQENLVLFMERYADYFNFALQDDGFYLGVPIIRGDTTIKKLLMIREDWANELMGGMPTTIEYLDAYMEAVLTSDPNGNGEADEVPFVFRDLSYYIDVFAPAYLQAGGAWYLDSSGNLAPPEMDPNYPALLSQLKEWMDKGYVYEDNLTADIAQLQQLIAQNKVGAAASTWTNPIIYNAWAVLVETEPDAQYEMALVTGSTGNNQYPVVNDLSSYTLITAACENPDAALRICDWSLTQEGYYTEVYGVKDDNYVVDENGYYHFLASDGSYTDSAGAGYYIYYMVQDTEIQPDWDSAKKGLLYLIDTWTNNTMNEEYRDMALLPQYAPVDWNITYDTSKWTSSAVLNDLSTYLEEQKIAVLLGDRPVSDWESIMADWRAMGGDQMIADKTAEYNRLKK